MKTPFAFLNRNPLGKLPLAALLLTLFVGLSACSEDDPTNGQDALLVVTPGAVVAPTGEAIPFVATLAKADGSTQLIADATWSISNQDLGSFSGNTFAVTGVGVGTITATVTVGGETYSAQAPISTFNGGVQRLAVTAPGAILGLPGDQYQLESVYLGQGSLGNITYSSSNDAVAGVSSSGLVDLKTAGSATITVTYSKDGLDAQLIPVVVLGTPPAELPITRVEVSPKTRVLFPDETHTFTAQAFKGQNTASTSFTWTSSDPEIATVDANGLVTAKAWGSVTIRATSAEGPTGEAQVEVIPRKQVFVDPISTSVQAGGSKAFTATVWEATRVGNTNDFTTSQVTPTPAITWSMPQTGVGFFDIGTVDATGTVSIKQNATPGLASFVLAEATGDPQVAPGAAMIQVAISDPNCDCGSDNPDVDAITVAQSSLNLSLFNPSPVDLGAQAVDDQGAPVAGANIQYCSDNLQVATVDFSGNVSPVGQGTATITACVGNVKTTVTVNVTF